MDIKAKLTELLLGGMQPSLAAKKLGVHHSKATRLRDELKELNSPKENKPQHDAEPSSKIIRVAFVTDSHNSPLIPQDRFTWIGKHYAESAPDYFIHGGDFATFDSVSRHESWGTITGNRRSPLQVEIDSMKRALDLMCKPLSKLKNTKFEILFGNHDERPELFENQHPELSGMLWSQIEGAFKDRGFETRPYRTWRMLGGVGFTHAPHNAAGKPYAAKHPENAIANDTKFSVCYGHTHRSVAKSFHKLGVGEKVTIFNPGCSLPQGHVEEYAKLGMAGWDWGIGELYIQDGNILGHSIIPMLELERRYK